MERSAPTAASLAQAATNDEAKTTTTALPVTGDEANTPATSISQLLEGGAANETGLYNVDVPMAALMGPEGGKMLRSLQEWTAAMERRGEGYCPLDEYLASTEEDTNYPRDEVINNPRLGELRRLTAEAKASDTSFTRGYWTAFRWQDEEIEDWWCLWFDRRRFEEDDARRPKEPGRETVWWKLDDLEIYIGPLGVSGIIGWEVVASHYLSRELVASFEAAGRGL